MTTQDARMHAPRNEPSDDRHASRQRRNVAVSAPRRLMGLAAALLCVAGPARAQSLGSAIGEAAETFQFRRTPPPAAEFVERARPDELGYQQLAPTDRANHRKSAAELDALASSLENAKATNRRAAQRVRAPDGSAGTKTAKAKLDPQDR